MTVSLWASGREGNRVRRCASLRGQTDLEFTSRSPRESSRAASLFLVFGSVDNRVANRADRLGTLSGRERPRIGTRSVRVHSLWCLAK